MKWSEEQITHLKEMCFQGYGNRYIAETLHAKLTAVYAKRSQLGITIDKVKGVAPKTKLEAALPKPKPGMHKDVKKAFDALQGAILLTMARDETSVRATGIYGALGDKIMDIEEEFESLISGLQADKLEREKANT